MICALLFDDIFTVCSQYSYPEEYRHTVYRHPVQDSTQGGAVGGQKGRDRGTCHPHPQLIIHKILNEIRDMRKKCIWIIQPLRE